MATNHTPPPDDSVPSGDPYAAPKVSPQDPVTNNPYASPPPGGAPSGGVPPGGMPPYAQQGQPGGYPAVQPPLTPSEERTWALVSHLSFFVLSVIGPLIVMLTFGKRSQFVRTQAVEALNFHLTLLIVFLVSFPLMFVLIGFATFFAALVLGVVMTVIAAVKISDGVDFRYPVTLRMIT